MKIIHLVESLAGAGGGLPAAVKSLIKLQDSLCYNVSCATTSEVAQQSQLDGWNIVHLKGHSVLSSIFNRYKLCESIFRKQYDFVHIHGLWNISYILICIACKLAKVKYVVTTHGQLLSTILNADSPGKRWKKKLYYFLCARSILIGSYKIHVSSENERLEFVSDILLSKKVVLISHIVDPIFFHSKFILDGARNCGNREPQFKDVLFVGRLDPRKGILDLIDGFASSALPSEWRLKLIGPANDPDFMILMRRRITDANLEDRVFIENPIYGDSRLKMYLSCYVFCLPSYSEAPGLVNIEAALCARPVITTPHTGLFDISAHGGVLCDTGKVSIRAALNEVASWTANEYASRSASIQKWAESGYSLSVITPQWKNFYS